MQKPGLTLQEILGLTVPGANPGTESGKYWGTCGFSSQNGTSGHVFLMASKKIIIIFFFCALPN